MRPHGCPARGREGDWAMPGQRPGSSRMLTPGRAAPTFPVGCAIWKSPPWPGVPVLLSRVRVCPAQQALPLRANLEFASRSTQRSFQSGDLPGWGQLSAVQAVSGGCGRPSQDPLVPTVFSPDADRNPFKITILRCAECEAF